MGSRPCAVVLLVALTSCGASDDAPEVLSTWGLFADAPRQVPIDGVVPYDVISPLFMDHAVKHRFVSLPDGAEIAYTDEGVWELPVGAILIKTFAYLTDARDPSLGERLIETRLLVHEEDGFHPYVYRWDEAQTEATRVRAGARVPVSWIDESGASQSLTYRVPNEAQCEGCHGGMNAIDPLGPKTLQLDRDFDYGAGPENQIDHMTALGLFDRTPPAYDARAHFEPPTGTGDIDARARAYLDANCAHCHRVGGSAETTGLWLGSSITDETALGRCRRPIAAGGGTGGFSYDVVPGDPDSSIMLFRVASEEPGIKMPELPSQLSDPNGVAVIREWIAAMPPASCM